MKQALLFLLLLSNLLMVHSSSAQCDPPTIAWDEDGIIINWIAQSEASSHELQYRKSGTFSWETVIIEDDTYYNILSFEQCEEFQFRIRSVCGNSKSGYYNLTAYPNCGSCNDTYCDIPQRAGNLGIEYVRIENIENTSNDDLVGYQDFRDVPEFILGPGQNAQIEIRVFDESIDADNSVVVGIDFNRNLEFEENELVVKSFVRPGEPLISSFDVPEDINFGISRVRIVTNAFNFNGDPFNICDNGLTGTGEVEEYCILLGEGPSLCDIDINIDVEELGSGTASMVWNDLPVAVGYNFRFKKTSEDEEEWVELTSLESTYELSDLENCTEYEFEVRSICPADTGRYENFVFNSFCPTSTKEENINITELSTYPNPWTSILNIKLEAKESTELSIVAYDLNGNQTSLVTKTVNSGLNEFSINEYSDLNPGIYLIYITDDKGNSQVHKTLKIQ